MLFGWNQKEYVVMDATDGDIDHIARLHAAGFARGWSTAEITDLWNQQGVTLLVSRLVGAPLEPIAGFNLIRQTEDEAEILSIAVDPKARKNGLGLALMRQGIFRLQADRVPSLVLEVDENNQAAIGLYAHLGFENVGLRPAYYKNGEGEENPTRATALVMRLDLS